jgi:hypothetical protein
MDFVVSNPKNTLKITPPEKAIKKTGGKAC